MEIKQLPYDARMYLCEDICKLADNLSKLDNDWKRTFEDLFNDYVPLIVKKNESDCFNFHINEIKYYLSGIYDEGTRPKSFIQLLDMALDTYLCEKVIININIVAYNFLINYVNANNLNKRVSYEMVETIAHSANEYTSPQELVDNLHSYLDD